MQILIETEDLDYFEAFNKFCCFREKYPFIKVSQTEKGHIQVYFNEIKGNIQISPNGKVLITVSERNLRTANAYMTMLLHTFDKLLKPKIVSMRILYPLGLTILPWDGYLDKDAFKDWYKGMGIIEELFSELW